MGDEVVYRERDGTEIVSRVTMVDGMLYKVEESGGCVYTAYLDGFAPSPTYENCNGSTGTQQVERSGRIFPLTVGSTESWKVAGSDNQGNTWDTTRNCVVEGTARVSVPAGAFDTYHVVCDDTWNRREWYYSPELSASVIYKRERSGRADGEYIELVEVRRAAS